MVQPKIRMKTEKIILSFVALFTGLLAAGVVFYLYQSTKVVPADKTKPIALTSPSPTPKSSFFLNISSPLDEEVVGKKSVIVSGNTAKDALIIVTSSVIDEVITPSQNGNFSTTITLEDGQNIIEITAIRPTGEEIVEKRTVTFSTENF